MNAMTPDQMLAMIAKLQADNEALAKAAQQPARKMTYKVGEKGGISIYGLGRFPVTAYASQWERIIEDIDNLKAFMVTNASLLTRKPMA